MPGKIDPAKVQWDDEAPIDPAAVKWDTFPTSPGLAFSAAQASLGNPEIQSAALKQLPLAGAMLLPLLGPGGIAADVALGGAGGMGGQLLEDIIRRNAGMGGPQTTGERLTSPLETGAEMGAWGAAGPLIGKVAQKVAAPAAEAMTEGGRKLLDFARRFDMPFSASTINPGKTATALETFVNLWPSGKYVTTKYQAELYRKFLDTRNLILGELTGTTGTMEGKTLQEGIKDTAAALKEASGEAYAAIVPAAGGKDVILKTPATRELIDGILESPRVVKNDALYKWLDSVYERTGTGLTAKQLDSFQRNIWGKVGKDRELGRELWLALEKDVRAFDEAAGKQLGDAIAGAKTAARAQFDYRDVAGIFRSASTVKNGEEFFQPDKFFSLLMNEKNQATIKRAYGADALQNMIDYAEFARKVAMENAKRTISGMGKVWQESLTTLGVGGTAGAAAMGHPAAAVGLAVPYGMSYVMAKMVMRPRGFFKKWLTEGFSIPKGATTALTVGGRAAISNRGGATRDF